MRRHFSKYKKGPLKSGGQYKSFYQPKQYGLWSRNNFNHPVNSYTWPVDLYFCEHWE